MTLTNICFRLTIILEFGPILHDNESVKQRATPYDEYGRVMF